jgi:hypothetical protein
VTENYDAVEKIGMTLKHDGIFFGAVGKLGVVSKNTGRLGTVGNCDKNVRHSGDLAWKQTTMGNLV